MTYRVTAPETVNAPSAILPENLRFSNHDVIFQKIDRGTVATNISFSYRFSQWKDKPEKDLQALADTYYDLVSHDVFTLDGEIIETRNESRHQEQAGDGMVTFSLSLINLPRDQTSVRIVPVLHRETPEGKWALDKVLTDEAFTIELPSIA